MRHTEPRKNKAFPSIHKLRTTGLVKFPPKEKNHIKDILFKKKYVLITQNNILKKKKSKETLSPKNIFKYPIKTV